MHNLKNDKGNIIIAGPCALESQQQLKDVVASLSTLSVTIIRASLWKPRTKPGWEGLGEIGIPMLLEETIPRSLTPATEVIHAEHAQKIIDALKFYGSKATALLWIGARNQNHLEQKRIAQVIANSSSNVYLMAKNQLWYDEKHWMGIYDHIVSTGFPKERLLLCHRGFSPGLSPNPEGYRNLPDFSMAMRIRHATGVPMLLDPSHIAGGRENVIDILRQGENYHFDGSMIEVHCHPDQALTDAKQQLLPEQLERYLKCLGLLKVAS